jgi:hypothetical protein
MVVLRGVALIAVLALAPAERSRTRAEVPPVHPASEWRRLRLLRLAGLVTGVVAAVLTWQLDSFGRGPMLAPAVFGLCVVLAVGRGETVVRPRQPGGVRRSLSHSCSSSCCWWPASRHDRRSSDRAAWGPTMPATTRCDGGRSTSSSARWESRWESRWPLPTPNSLTAGGALQGLVDSRPSCAPAWMQPLGTVVSLSAVLAVGVLMVCLGRLLRGMQPVARPAEAVRA